MTDADKFLIGIYETYCIAHDIKIKSVGMAQAMIESSHATSSLYTVHNNPFGIKYTERADYPVSYDTREFINGEWQTVHEQFSGFTDIEHGFNDYCHIVHPERIFSVDDYLKHLSEIGYATDPNYLNLILEVIDDYDLRQYDGYARDEDLEKLDKLHIEYTNQIELMAYKVIDGKYGNGEERKSKLGMYYDIIQDRVDEILR
jgi:hypothetical protein